jgi:hypothetical protein
MKFINIGVSIVLLVCVLFGTKIYDLLQNHIAGYITEGATEKVARDVLYKTGFKIANQYFPLGSGFATYGGWIARSYYSPLYLKYGFTKVWGLQKIGNSEFLNDTFWPYIYGQFGFIGCILYFWILLILMKVSYNIFRTTTSPYVRIAGLTCLLALIESLSESSANPVYVASFSYFLIFSMLGITHSFLRTQKIIIQT